jgi:L-lactate dehydrogenase
LSSHVVGPPRNERAVLPVSGWVAQDDICLSLPSVVGASGIERRLQPALSEVEATALQASAATLAEALAGLDGDRR